ncbi:uncharacterized protein [Salvelinus alpinus]|uniref:uncharacterized protein isoform X5 n=1 Tax=Salvelinus alpinus TaxID=8036 RepID=UPI0039FBBFE0
MHHLCIVRGVEKQLWWSRVIQEKVLDPWGLVQVVFNNKEVTGIKKDPWPCQEEQVDISTTVERFQESADEMTAYQLSTSDVITTLMSLPSPMILRHPLRLPFSLLIPLSVPLHLTTPPRTRPLAALLRSLWRSKMMLQLRGYFANQGTTNFSLRLAGIRRGGEKTLTSADSTSLNYLTHAGRMVLSGPAGCKAFYFFLGSLYLFCQFGLIPSTTRNPTNLPTETHEVSTNRLPYYAILLPIAIYPASCLDRRDPNQPLLTGPLLITRLSMPLLNIDRINFAEVFYEFVLLILLEGKTYLPTSRPGSFLCLLLEATMRIRPGPRLLVTSTASLGDVGSTSNRPHIRKPCVTMPAQDLHIRLLHLRDQPLGQLRKLWSISVCNKDLLWGNWLALAPQWVGLAPKWLRPCPVMSNT